MKMVATKNIRFRKLKLPFLFLSIVFVLLNFRAQTQNIYFGFPYNLNKLNTGDKVIISIPSHTDVRFSTLEEFDTLISLLAAKPANIIRIEINAFFGTPDDSKAYSEFLLKDLDNILKSKSNNTNYQIWANGSKYPIFTMEQVKDMHKDSNTKIMYKKYNTRIEISID